MLAVKGYSDGEKVIPLDPNEKLPKGEALIILSESEKPESEPLIDADSGTLTLEEFLSLCGAWQNDRPVKEIVREIYESRTINPEPPDFDLGKK